MPVRVRGCSLLFALTLCAWALVAMGQAPIRQTPGSSRIVTPIDDAQAVTLTGNLPPLARAEFDQGEANPETQLDWMVLELEPSAAQQAELDALVDAQHDPASPLYQRWLTPQEYGARFGLSAQDLAQISAWLQGHGLQIQEIAASNRLIAFSGTAAAVEETFHTAIHRYLVDGVSHLANSEEPQIPAALEGIVGGVVTLNDFRRTSEIAERKMLTNSRDNHRPIRLAGQERQGEVKPLYSSGSTHYLMPADYSTIYDLNPLYTGGTTGVGTSIAIVGRSNINVSDVTAFRTAAGLPANNPSILLVSANPGLVAGDQDESTLDVEWSGAVAPAAAVKLVVGESTGATDGVDLSAQFIVNHTTAPVVSVSYGTCEQHMGSTELAFYNGLWEQAASQGMSVLVAAGDAGAAGCDSGGDSTGSGLAVNGLCSSPYSTCVGGTEFNEGSDSAEYWSATNTTSDGSALSYIPEEVWNESALDGGSGLWSTGGGTSVVYPQPSWQKGVTGSDSGMRSVPDVAMAAAGHDGFILYENGSYWIISGTSAAAPSFAGVMALVVNAKNGVGQGNANTGLYPLVGAAHNPFHPTPSGNNSVPGVTGFTASGGGYNLATGLGSVDGAVLVDQWGPATGGPQSADFAMTPSATSGTALAGKAATFTVSITESGAGKNAVVLTAKTPAGVTANISPASITPGTPATVTLSVASSATTGAQAISITGSDASGTQTLTFALTVTQPPTLTLTSSANSVSVSSSSAGTASLAVSTGGSFSGAISLSVSGLPNGVTAAWSANSILGDSGSAKSNETLTLSAAPTAAAGTAGITVTATGDGLTASEPLSLQVQQAQGASPTLSIMPSSASMSVVNPIGAIGTAESTASQIVALAGTSFIGPVTLSVSGLPAFLSASWSNSSVALSAAGTGSSTLTVTAGIGSEGAPDTTVMPGTYFISITATGDGLTVTKTIQVQVAGGAVTPSATTRSIRRPINCTNYETAGRRTPEDGVLYRRQSSQGLILFVRQNSAKLRQ